MQRILILEDDVNRIVDFKKITEYEVVITDRIEKAITLLKSEKWDAIFMDHDLGYRKTGYDLAKWMAMNPEFIPTRVYCHSYNPGGIKNIIETIKNAGHPAYVWNFDSIHDDIRDGVFEI
jgi:CheY-like chemotaxis protein